MSIGRELPFTIIGGQRIQLDGNGDVLGDVPRDQGGAGIGLRVQSGGNTTVSPRQVYVRRVAPPITPANARPRLTPARRLNGPRWVSIASTARSMCSSSSSVEVGGAGGEVVAAAVGGDRRVDEVDVVQLGLDGRPRR